MIVWPSPISFIQTTAPASLLRSYPSFWGSGCICPWWCWYGRVPLDRRRSPAERLPQSAWWYSCVAGNALFAAAVWPHRRFYAPSCRSFRGTLLNNEPVLSLDDANSEYKSSLGDVHYKRWVMPVVGPSPNFLSKWKCSWEYNIICN